MPLENLDETARTILDAASRRFLHYGYGKTTMSEIAKDCNMSTGNVYRYFPSKLDIAETFVRVLRREHMAKLEKALKAEAKTPPERLRCFLKTKFKLAYDRFHDRPKAYELSSEILNERPEVAVEWEESEGKLITEILKAGVEAGVFPDGDLKRYARVIQDAVFRFTSPAVFHEGDFDALASELDEVIAIILDAFSWRSAGYSDKAVNA